jgi:hypothetical protein
MDRTQDETLNTQDDQFVNYLPGMPKLSPEPGWLERFVRKLLRRRGPLRPVVRPGDETVGRRDEE